MNRIVALKRAYDALDTMPHIMRNEEAKNIITDMIVEEENKEKTE